MNKDVIPPFSPKWKLTYNARIIYFDNDWTDSALTTSSSSSSSEESTRLLLRFSRNHVLSLPRFSGKSVTLLSLIVPSPCNCAARNTTGGGVRGGVRGGSGASSNVGSGA
jgi:hypothetical protein